MNAKDNLIYTLKQNPGKFTAKELAEKCGCSLQHVYRVVQQHKEFSLRKKNTLKAEITDFINSNPEAFSISEVARKFKVSRQYVHKLAQQDNLPVRRLSEQEAAVHKFLLGSIEPQTVPEISKATGIKNRYLYSLLRRLARKGFASYTIKRIEEDRLAFKGVVV